jgi:HK97 family phage major capsid protein
MKEKLLKMLNAKKEQREALGKKAEKAETAEELRGINSQVATLANEITTIEGMISDAEDREKEIAKREKNILMLQGDKKEADSQEYRAIAKMLTKASLTPEERALVTVADNGAILPEGFVNQLQILRKGFPSLKPYCHVIPVTTQSGKMPFATIGSNKLSKLTSGVAIPEASMATSKIDYAIDDYGKIIPVENSLLEDEVVGIIQNVITPDFAEASVLTENDEIMTIISTNATAVTGAASYEDVEGAINGILPSLRYGAVTVTNLTGYVYLKGVKDNEGRSLELVKTMPDGTEVFNGKPLVVLDDAVVEPATEGNLIFYVVNIWALVKFFDRKGYVISSSEHALFGYNQTAIRVLERFDVAKLDARACLSVEFTKPA